MSIQWISKPSERATRGSEPESAHDEAGRPTVHQIVTASPVPTAKIRPDSGRLRRLLILSDVCAVVVGATIATVTQQFLRSVSSQTLVIETLLAIVVVPIWVAAMGANQLFRARAVSRFGEELRHLLMAGFLTIGILLAGSFIVRFRELSRLWIMLLFVCVTGSLIVSRLVARRVFANLRRRGRIWRPVIIVGTGTDAVALLNTTQRRPELGYEVVGFTGDRTGSSGQVNVLGAIEDTADVVRQTGATGVILSVASLEPIVVNQLTRNLTDQGCHVTLSSSLYDIDISRARSQEFDGQLMIYVEPTNRSRSRLLVKRSFDVVVAAVVLVLTMPIMLAAMVAIKLESRGPVLFKQVRVGKDGELFGMYKFRSMIVGAEAMRADLESLNESSGPLFKLRADPRITRVGRILRKTSIDELPQLWNVITGEMSVVGPRPALPAEAAQWSASLHERLRVLPGITGMWQVSGRSDADFDMYRRLDLFYVDNWSLAHDLQILLKTFFVVLAGRGAA